MTAQLLLEVNDDQRRAIREKVNIKSEKQVEEDVNAVVEWFKKQQHLPRIDLDRRLIECILVSRKGSVEQTKQKIDMMYTLRTLVPEMALTRDILHPRIQNCLKGLSFITFPKLNHDYTRVSLLTYKDPEFFNLLEAVNYCFTIIEHRLIHDSFAGDRYIVDLTNIALGHVTKYTPALIKNSELYIRKAYGLRLFGIHIINASSLVNTLLGIMKAGLSEKIASRIYVHSTYEDLYKVIDKDILPVEYGGTERKHDHLVDDWIKELSTEEHRNYLIGQEKYRSNEALRIGGKLDDELLGVAGSFKKLDVD